MLHQDAPLAYARASLCTDAEADAVLFRTDVVDKPKDAAEQRAQAAKLVDGTRQGSNGSKLAKAAMRAAAAGLAAGEVMVINSQTISSF